MHDWKWYIMMEKKKITDLLEQKLWEILWHNAYSGQSIDSLIMLHEIVWKCHSPVWSYLNVFAKIAE